jgi:hypothetical protein
MGYLRSTCEVLAYTNNVIKMDINSLKHSSYYIYTLNISACFPQSVL